MPIHFTFLNSKEEIIPISIVQNAVKNYTKLEFGDPDPNWKTLYFSLEYCAIGYQNPKSVFEKIKYDHLKKLLSYLQKEIDLVNWNSLRYAS